MTVQSALVDAIDEAVKPLGFRRRGNSWYRISENFYSVVSVQPSRWDESSYVNLGFSTAERARNKWVPESKCDIRFRVDAINSVARQDLRLLEGSARRELGDAQWRRAVTDRIALPVAQIMGVATTLDGLMGVLKSQVSGQVFIHREMRALLEPSEGKDFD